MRSAFLIASALGLFAALVNAQEYRATLVGSVTDQSGAAVPGTRLTVTNTETGVSVISPANDQGRYVIPFLLPGRYKVHVEQPGFKSFERGPVELRINDRVELNIVLEVGELSDKVTVTSEAPLLETSSSSRGQVIDNRKITDLPLNGRNPFELVNIATGVQYSGSSLTYFRPFDNGSINDFSINGGQHSMNEVQLDGVPNNAIANYGNVQQVAYVPPVEATQEFKIQTNTYDAQYGRTGGGVISLSIKPGTNRLHGAVYEYMRRSALDANQYSNNATGSPARTASSINMDLKSTVRFNCRSSTAEKSAPSSWFRWRSTATFSRSPPLAPCRRSCSAPATSRKPSPPRISFTPSTIR
jgi:hypothetical protein